MKGKLFPSVTPVVLRWKHMAPQSFTSDNFKQVPGAFGSLDQEPKQIEVIKCYKYHGKSGDLLKAFEILYPGDMGKHVGLINAEMKRLNPKVVTLTSGEWVVFLSLLVGATLQRESGHALWDPPPADRPFHRGHPNFDDHMRRRRFDEIKTSCTKAFGDEAKEGTDAWFKIRSGVDGHNANRLRTVNMSEVIVPDELMSPFRPRTTASGELDHISFVDRKPKPMGTEFKCVCDGRHGLMLYLEIQEGQGPMSKKQFRDKLAPAAAIGARMALGSLGRL